jgi:putative phosphotransacetylase
VEISLTDARALGCTAPIRESGDVAGSGSIRLAGPKGEVFLEEGLICAQRHVHLSPRDAEMFGVKDGDFVKVRIHGARPLCFEKVDLRVRGDYAAAMHIDTDEANAAGIDIGVFGDMVISDQA